MISSSPEHIRLEQQAVLLSGLMNHRIFHAPVKDGPHLQCLDIGCGTGIVTDNMATTLPQAQCFGVDLSPVPNMRAPKPNVRFFQGNVGTQPPSQWIPNDRESGFERDHEVFDYVFSRLLIFGVTDWPAYIRTQFDLLKPGGWAEVHDCDWTYFNEAEEVISDEWSWLQTLHSICEGEKGMDFQCGRKVVQWMEQAGFRDIQVFKYKWSYDPLSTQEPGVREFGEWQVRWQPGMINTMIERSVTSGHGAGMVEHNAIVRMQDEMRKCLAPEKGKHIWFYVTIGQKPPGVA